MDGAFGVIVAGLSPHPPVIVPEVGGRDALAAQSTANALKTLSSEIAGLHPETIVVIGPHGPVLRDAIACTAERRLTGDLSGFGAPQVSLAFDNDLELAGEIREQARATPSATALVMVGQDERRTYQLSRGLDHGAVVPLCFLKQAGFSGRLVNLTMGFLPHLELYEFGTVVARAAEKRGRRVAVIASGDLSHRLTRDAPAGFHPRGKDFDAGIMASVRASDPSALLHMDEDLVQDAGECGLRPIIMMFGSLDGRKVTSRVLSYEGPFGVGYGVALLLPGERDASREFARAWREDEADQARKLGDAQSPIVALARGSLESWVRDGRRISPGPEHAGLLGQRAGAFVSLKKHGRLRGCIGTTEPTTKNLAEEVIQNAISAGTQDTRFTPVEPDELDSLVCSVDVLSPAEPVSGMNDLDPKVYGVIVEKPSRRGALRGLLLPDLEGIDTVEKQVQIAKQKAGIRPADQDVKLYRFTVTRYH